MITALYRRVSTLEQAESGYSIDEQKDRLEKYAASMGWQPVKDYCDAGFSGAKLDRPALHQLIQDIQTGKVDRVVVWKLDRLSRSQKDTLYIIEDVILRAGASFVSMSENFDTATPFGRAMIGILAVFAQLEREQIKERTKLGRMSRAKKGLFRGSGTIPIGYDYYDGELHVNEYEAGLIRRIYSDYSTGLSLARIASDLNEEGLVHKHGPWNALAIHRALNLPIYRGFITFDGQLYPGTHEPLVSPELYQRCQAVLARNSEYYHRGDRPLGNITSLLGGLVRCGCCGGKYFIETSYHEGKNGQLWSYRKYRCQNRKASTAKRHGIETCKNKNWTAGELEALVFGEISKLALEPLPESSPAPAQRTPSAADLNKIDKQIGRLMDLYALGTMPVEILQEKVDALNRQKAALEKKLSRKKKSPQDRAGLINKARSFASILETGDFQEIHRLLVALIDHIEITGDDVAIFWNFA